MFWVAAVVVSGVAFASLAGREHLALENLALRQQLAVLRRRAPRPKLRLLDRLFWVALSRLWRRWREALHIVTPDTVIAWHRAGFRLFWRWRSRGGRPQVAADLRALVRKMSTDNPAWGAPRIHGELLKLGFLVAQSTVAALMPKGPRPKKPPSQTWRAFLKNHLSRAAAMDFFVIPTASFRLLYGLVILEHGRRRIQHIAVTTHPTAEWTSQQLREAFPFDTAPRFLHRDRDGIYGNAVTATIRAMGIEQVLSAPRSPWQNPYCERVINTLRRELLDNVIVLGESHARRLLKEYVEYYNSSRTHLALAKDSPSPARSSLPRTAPSTCARCSAVCTTATSAAPRSRRVGLRGPLARAVVCSLCDARAIELVVGLAIVAVTAFILLSPSHRGDLDVLACSLAADRHVAFRGFR